MRTAPWGPGSALPLASLPGGELGCLWVGRSAWGHGALQTGYQVSIWLCPSFVVRGDPSPPAQCGP